MWGLVAPTALLAQSAVEEPPPPKFIFGPLGVTPRIALTKVGVDTNPLNTPGASDRDFTATIEPGVDSSLRMGRARLSGKTSLEYLYFNESSSQRSINLSQEGRIELSMHRVRPYMFGGYLRTRQRPTPEIDLRVQQKTTHGGIGSGLRLGSRLRMDAEVRRTRFEFGEGRHGSLEVANALNRDSDVGKLTTRFILTPLTTFAVRTEVEHDRFKFSAVRDNNSFSVIPGFELKPSALISGAVFAGYKRFNAQHPTVPDFSGVVVQADAQYVMREATLFNLQVERDLTYSIDPEQPYYVQTGVSLSVTQMLGLNWFFSGRLGQTRLAYRDFLSLAGDADGVGRRTDRVLLHGVSFGRRLGEDIRIGFDVNYVRRHSSVARSEYEGYRFGGSISYGS